MKAVKIIRVLFKTDKTVFPLKKDTMKYQINYPKNDKKSENVKEKITSSDEVSGDRVS